jgi:hypothetical protein
VLAGLLLAACGRSAPGPDLDGLPDLVKPGETLVMARVLFAAVPAPAASTPAAPGPAAPATAAPAPAAPAAGAPEALALVVRTTDSHDEFRVAEKRDRGWVVVHLSRPGDEFRNLQVEDVNDDGRPEVVSRWAGGQIEIVEVLGRSADGAWAPLFQNGAQVIEERRRRDRTIAFWLTGRTYEENPGQPPVYETTVYAWNGQAFAEEPRLAAAPEGAGPAAPAR